MRNFHGEELCYCQEGFKGASCEQGEQSAILTILVKILCFKTVIS